MATVPLQISFRDIAHSDAIEARIREHAEKLSRFKPRITSCRVVVAAPERGHHRERLYSVKINIVMPGGNLWINRSSQQARPHTDVFVAIRDAFLAADRRIEDFARKQTGRVKPRGISQHGVVTDLNAKQGYGFITTEDGEEVYFSADSVVEGGKSLLKEGSNVRFELGETAMGSHAQANVVRIVGRRPAAKRR